MASITALGGVTSVGHNAITTCASIRAGISRPNTIEDFTVLDLVEQEPTAAVGHPILRLTRGFSHVGRWLQMAGPALKDMCTSAGLPGVDNSDFWQNTLCLVVVAMTDEPRFLETVLGADDEALKKDLLAPLKARVAPFFAPKQWIVMSRGRVGALECMGLANEHFQAGHYQRVVVLAVDSLADEQSLFDLVRQGRLKEDSNPVGLMPGEGAIAFMLEAPQTAKTRGATRFARVAAVATALEAKSFAVGQQSHGEALSGTVARALSQARVQLPFVGAPIVDLNGEKWRSEEYGHAMIRVPQTQWNSTSVDVPASSVGDIGAATTALHVILACRGLSRGYQRDDGVMIVASDESGQVGTTIITREK